MQQNKNQQQGQTQEQKAQPEPKAALGGAGQRTGGGRNAQKSNQNRQQSAQGQLAEAKKKLADLRATSNKTQAQAEPTGGGALRGTQGNLARLPEMLRSSLVPIKMLFVSNVPVRSFGRSIPTLFQARQAIQLMRIY